MLNKNQVYVGFSKPYEGRNQSPSNRFSRVKILFEDDVSYYVESQTEQDQAGHKRRYSAKKHCFVFLVVGTDRTPEICKTCPLRQASKKYQQGNN